MAKYQTIHSPFQGRVGNVIGSSWKGIPYMKANNDRSNKRPSPAQLIERAKFRLLIRFVSSMGKLLMLTFKNSAIHMTGTNSAYSYNRIAITGEYPGFSLDYTKVLISKGELLNAGDPSAAPAGNGLVQFSWTDNSGMAMANADDRSILVIHCPLLTQTAFTTAWPVRSSGVAVLNVSNFMGKQVQTWISFISAGGEVATSIYTGELTIGQ